MVLLCVVLWCCGVVVLVLASVLLVLDTNTYTITHVHTETMHEIPLGTMNVGLFPWSSLISSSCAPYKIMKVGSSSENEKDET